MHTITVNQQPIQVCSGTCVWHTKNSLNRKHGTDTELSKRCHLSETRTRTRTRVEQEQEQEQNDRRNHDNDSNCNKPRRNTNTDKLQSQSQSQSWSGTEVPLTQVQVNKYSMPMPPQAERRPFRNVSSQKTCQATRRSNSTQPYPHKYP
jgi:hypothetical protein